MSLPSVPLATTRPSNVKRLIKINFNSTEKDYAFVQKFRSDQGTLVANRKNRNSHAIIRESFSPTPLQMLEALAKVKHPNIADILDVYFHDTRLYVVGEHLHVALLDLGFKRVALEEWEIATIIAEVTKAMTYLLDTLPNYEFHIDSVRLSLQGDVKLVLDLHYESSREECNTPQRYNSEVLVEILEFLMSRGTPNGTGWSQDVLDFLTVPLIDSLTPFINHAFLGKAVFPSQLIPLVHDARSSKARS